MWEYARAVGDDWSREANKSRKSIQALQAHRCSIASSHAPPHPPTIYPLCLVTQAEVHRYRSQEARILRKSAFWLGIFATTLFFGPVLMAILTFGAYAVGGNALSAANGEQQCQ